MTELNETILDCFHEYLQEMNVGDALATIFEEAEQLFTEEQLEEMVSDILFPQIIRMFATEYISLHERCDYSEEDNLMSMFEQFCHYHGLTELQDILVERINEAAKADAAEEDGIDDDDAGVITKYWNALENKVRLQKTKAFLHRLATQHTRIANLQPFLSKKIGEDPDPYGNRFAEKVKKGDWYGSDHKPANEGNQLPSVPIMEELLTGSNLSPGTKKIIDLRSDFWAGYGQERRGRTFPRPRFCGGAFY